MSKEIAYVGLWMTGLDNRDIQTREGECRMGVYHDEKKGSETV
jgi:hypothetical protein